MASTETAWLPKSLLELTDIFEVDKFWFGKAGGKKTGNRSQPDYQSR